MAGAWAPEYNPVGSLPDDAIVVEWPGVAVSSSEVRRRIRAGAPIEYLVPRGVGDYLKGHRLYL
jgi:nicotinic acid mononucleotide adenylyltransferase